MAEFVIRLERENLCLLVCFLLRNAIMATESAWMHAPIINYTLKSEVAIKL